MCFRCHGPNGWYSGRFDSTLGGDGEGQPVVNPDGSIAPHYDLPISRAASTSHGDQPGLTASEPARAWRLLASG